MTWWPFRRREPARFHPAPDVPFTNSVAALISAGAGWELILPMLAEWERSQTEIVRRQGDDFKAPAVPPMSHTVANPADEARRKKERNRKARWRAQKAKTVPPRSRSRPASRQNGHAPT